MQSSMSIHDLPPEILCLVFKANANMESHPQTLFFDSDTATALGDTLFASRVCKLWRVLILGSPSLWGGLVDVDYLMRLNPVGRDEVVRRTGNALLSIRGSVAGTESYDFIIPPLLANWKRIETLSITIPDNTFPDPSKPGWEPLYWSATNLRSFSFVLYRCPERVNPVGFGPGLFNNDAPRLRVFESPCLPDPRDLTSSKHPYPFAQVRRLRLQEVVDSIPLGSLLDSLKSMHRLESLSLTSTSRERPMIATTFPVVRLPSLLNLKLTFTPILWATILLESLVPDRGCGLQLTWGNPPVIKDATDKKRFNDVLTRYVTNAFCNNSTCDRLRVSFTPNLLQIKQHSITMAPHLSDLDHPPGISLSFLRSSKSYTSILSETFHPSTIFSSCDFTGIKTLELTLKRVMRPRSSS
ncbi:hypothetical protein NLJ89_g3249 [Agrocybe chaxingu]|uniref:F-box domain-containing protein n=1 Tax=Agrocybe chaxingu TaxID=84603 RepID=A0A9W8MVP0_9AGAR|nr:hypothetical protein NLJ89_g3249 [Agrocybe chaxingu]